MTAVPRQTLAAANWHAISDVALDAKGKPGFGINGTVAESFNLDSPP